MKKCDKREQTSSTAKKRSIPWEYFIFEEVTVLRRTFLAVLFACVDSNEGCLTGRVGTFALAVSRIS